jgi:CheY-like chemotaxis protein
MKTLMVVQDKEVTREGLTAVLRREGYGVEAVTDGRLALDRLGTGRRPDLSLLAMFTPVLDGWGFPQAFQRLMPRLSTPVVVLAPAVHSLEWATEHGCVGLVREPIDTRDLLAELRRCLGE